MTVIRFPKQRNPVLETGEEEEEYTGLFSDSDDATCQHEDAFPPDDFPRRNAGGARKKRIRPTDILASLIPPGNTIQGKARTPVDILAGILPPAPPDDAHDALQQRFWAVWLQHRDQLLHKSYYFLNRRKEDAEDALGVAMLKALKSFMESGGHIDNPRAWLGTILHNACMDGHRTTRRTREMIVDAEISEFEEMACDDTVSGRTPEEIASVRESLESLYKQILSLPQMLQTPLLLRTVEHLSYEEIAERLQISEANVRKRVQQAREQLRTQRDYESLSQLFATPFL